MLLVKAIAAFCLGAALLAGAQHAYVWAIKRQVQSAQAGAGLPRIGKSPDFAGNFNAGGFKGAILPNVGAIDTTTGQRLAIEGAARRIDLQNRAALNAVPLPPRIHTGIPRR